MSEPRGVQKFFYGSCFSMKKVDCFKGILCVYFTFSFTTVANCPRAPGTYKFFVVNYYYVNKLEIGGCCFLNEV